ncbi:trigger factor [Mycoplasma tauri]|uniref:trigger factor n=1 Tax=Mycoplasma tauri TaxID=547987 RepID=UPI001967BB23|nr:trigger factor [Mycoplasma tauri]MBZ4212550.1 trigger factor [Mycoplasma tauri]MBZ4218495.1 trigger factor [Mycoplasma tauri]MBZ4226693.1 trigger factor [Mycoplasma tauri]QSB07286.1 trigger factor [Mycoplasma tauri]
MSKKSIEFKKDQNSVVVEYEFKGERWNKIYNKTKARKIKNFKIDGFRPGKAPKHLVDKHITPVSVAYDSINDAYVEFANDIFEVVKKEYNNAIQNATLLDVPVLGEESSVVKLEFPLMPDLSKITIDNSLKIKGQKLEVSAKDVDNYVKDMVQSNALLLPLKKGQKTKLGDTVTIKYKGFVNNEPFDGGEADNYDLKLGSKTFIDTFEDQLVDKTIGWKGDVKVKFPEEYAVPTLKGQNAIFECEILDAKRPEDIKITDETIAELNIPGISTVKEIKEDSKDKLTIGKYFDNLRLLMNDVVRTLVKKHEIVIADSLVAKGAENRIAQIKAELKKQDIKLNDYLELIKTSEKDFFALVLKEEKENAIHSLVHEKVLELNAYNNELTDDDWNLWAVSISTSQQQSFPLAFVVQYVNTFREKAKEAKEDEKANVEKSPRELAALRNLYKLIDKEAAEANDKIVLKLAKKLISSAQAELDKIKKEAEESKNKKENEEVVETK